MTVGRLLALDPDPASQGTALQLSALLEPPNLSQKYGTLQKTVFITVIVIQVIVSR